MLIIRDGNVQCFQSLFIAGRFSPEQWALYEAVLEVHELCIQQCAQPGVSIDYIYIQMTCPFFFSYREIHKF